MVFTDKINIVMHDTSQGIYKKNILSKSLNIEVLKSSCGILLIFFFLVVASRFVGYFEQASEGLIDPNLILYAVFLRIPDFITLLIPLSFFLGVVLTISRLYAESEIYGYFSVGLSKFNLLKFLLPQAAVFFLMTLSLSLYIAPYTKELSKELIEIDTIEEKFQAIKPNKIIVLDKNSGFIFAEYRNDLEFGEVALFISDGEDSSLILSEKMTYEDINSHLILEFENGIFNSSIFKDDYKIKSNFGKLSIPLEKNKNTISGLTFAKLFDYSSSSTKSQILWNVSIPITILVLLMLGVSISKVEPRQGRLSVIFPAMLIYIFYLSLLILARDFVEDNPQQFGYVFWLVHTFFLIVGFLLLARPKLLSKTNLFNHIRQSYALKIMLIIFGSLIALWVIT